MTVPAGTPPSGTPLLNANFCLYLLGLGSTALADATLSVALPFAVLAHGGTRAQLAAVLLCASLPRFAALVLGALADRLNPRLSLLLSALLRTLMVAALSWAALHGHASTALFAVFALLNSTLVTLTVTTGTVVVPRLVPSEQLARANSLVGAASMGLPLVGYGLGGLLVASLGSGRTLLISAPLYALMALVVLLLRGPVWTSQASQPTEPRPSLLADIAEGWRLRRGNRVLSYMLLLTFALNFSLNILNVRAPLFSKASGWGAGGYALLEGLFSGGALLGIVVVGVLSRVSLRAQIAAALLIFGAGMLAHAPAHFSLWLVGSALAGISVGLLDVASMTQLQRLVPDGLRGRLTGTSISMGALGLSSGALVAGLPWTTTLLMSTLGLVLAGLSLGWLVQSRAAKPLTAL